MYFGLDVKMGVGRDDAITQSQAMPHMYFVAAISISFFHSTLTLANGSSSGIMSA
jgi:hypothetical protein